MFAITHGSPGHVRCDPVHGNFVDVERHDVVPARVKGLGYGGAEVSEANHDKSLRRFSAHQPTMTSS
jgi:hypothetical protein